MIAYLDASVILRFVLGQTPRLREWKALRGGVASALVEVECLRTIDRLRIERNLSDREIVTRREHVFLHLEKLDVVEMTQTVLARAAQPFPTSLGTLDAIHLATALLWKETTGAELVMATHDESLAVAARASGMHVIGACN